jgi:gluconolactonase
MIRFFLFLGLAFSILAAEPDFPLTADSQPQASVPKGEIIKGSYTARDGSVFPGTVRDYQIYLPAGLDKTQPAAFMVFQDGVIYQAPVVFDNLIAKKDIPPLVGIFIKPGIVPAANENALPRFNRSYEYDSITPTYSQFLIDEFLPAIESRHSLKLSTDPNHAAISGNSSGGICAFMVAWHRPDRFRRVFTGVGTYVGIHGADQLPVLVRKFEPKPLRIFLQSGTGDNNLYCGDWWMANQMMERSLTWAGYDVNHAWGEGGHNAKHATQIFPDVLRWLWRDWQTTTEIKANPKGESKWKGYEVVGTGEWEKIWKDSSDCTHLAADTDGVISFCSYYLKKGPLDETQKPPFVRQITSDGTLVREWQKEAWAVAAAPSKQVIIANAQKASFSAIDSSGNIKELINSRNGTNSTSICVRSDGIFFTAESFTGNMSWGTLSDPAKILGSTNFAFAESLDPRLRYHSRVTLSPDQTVLYSTAGKSPHVGALSRSAYVTSWVIAEDGKPTNGEPFGQLDTFGNIVLAPSGLCVDTNGWLYVATSLGIQVCDQAGRVNFIIPTPKPALDVCFGGKDLSELFIACGDTIYKRPTKAKGVVSGQQSPIKPAPPKL